MRRHAAFTLVEVLAALVVLALLAGAVTARLGSLLRRSTLDRAESAAMELDRLARTTARSGGQHLQIVFDLDGGRAGYGPLEADQEGGVVTSVSLGVERVRRASGEFTGGQVEIPCSSAGLTETYAVRLAGGDSSGRWLLLAGLSGMVEVFDDSEQFERAWKVATSAGGDPR